MPPKQRKSPTRQKKIDTFKCDIPCESESWPEKVKPKIIQCMFERSADLMWIWTVKKRSSYPI